MNLGLHREVRNAHANLEVVSKYQWLGLDVRANGEVLRTEFCTIPTIIGWKREENLTKMTKKQQPITGTHGREEERVLRRG